jgi:glycine cleavage system H protein
MSDKSKVPGDLKYTKSHEWVRQLPDGRVEIGITDHAQGALGDLVFVDVPEQGRRVNVGEAFAVVESVKAASDVYSPVSGKVLEGNAALAAEPELLNREPYGAGWLIRLEPNAGTAPAALLDADAYVKFLAETAE